MNNEEKILELLVDLKQDVTDLKKEVADIRQTVDRHTEILESHDKLLRSQGELLRVQGEILHSHDELLRSQGEMLRSHDELLKELDERSLRSAVMLENVVCPQLKLLYEGQVTLQQTLAPIERVEALEEDVRTIKSSITHLAARQTALEKKVQ